MVRAAVRALRTTDFLGHFLPCSGCADKILKGAKPSDLPIEKRTRFKQVMSLKTAKALGLAVPTLLICDEII